MLNASLTAVISWPCWTSEGGSLCQHGRRPQISNPMSLAAVTAAMVLQSLATGSECLGSKNSKTFWNSLETKTCGFSSGSPQIFFLSSLSVSVLPIPVSLLCHTLSCLHFLNHEACDCMVPFSLQLSLPEPGQLLGARFPLRLLCHSQLDEDSGGTGKC